MFKKKEKEEESVAEPKAKPAAAIIESGQNIDIYNRNNYYDM